MFRKITLKIIFSMLLSAIALADESGSYYYPSIDKAMFKGFEGEGSFVEAPAYVGDCFGYTLLGIPLGIVISQPVRFMNFNETSDDIGFFTLQSCTMPFGVLFGGIPWLLKKPFWDFPIWIAGGKETKEAVAMPEIEVPPQLLEPPKVLLEEQSAYKVEPKMAELVEPAPLPEIKTDIPSLPTLDTDTLPIPQTTPEPIMPVITPVPETPPKTIDHTTQPGTKTWEGVEMPEWLMQDLSKEKQK